jgi:hypothetical protein
MQCWRSWSCRHKRRSIPDALHRLAVRVMISGAYFGDLVEDLLGQIEFFGDSLHDVVLDGVLRREDGGYVAWGHGAGPLEAASPSVVPRLLGPPTISEGADPVVVIHASLQLP